MLDKKLKNSKGRWAWVLCLKEDRLLNNCRYFAYIYIIYIFLPVLKIKGNEKGNSLEIPNTLRQKTVTTSFTKQKSGKENIESKCEVANLEYCRFRSKYINNLKNYFFYYFYVFFFHFFPFIFYRYSSKVVSIFLQPLSPAPSTPTSNISIIIIGEYRWKDNSIW